MTIPVLHQLFEQHPLISTDTRKIQQNSIFFALKGSNFNGNEFALQALQEGCAWAVIDEARYAVNEKTILVEDVLKCLQDLAHYHRKKWGKTVVALTGSNGKTTTKELIAAVLERQYHVLYTKGNFNNHIGVPLTLLSIKPEHELAVVEMGANHQKEIEQLCSIAQPDYGIITNIGKAHLEGFGGEEGVLKGKGEMYTFMKDSGGTIFINADDSKLVSIAQNMKAITYGFGSQNNINGELLTGTEWATVKVTVNHESILIKSNLTGSYNGINILCACAVGHHFTIPLNTIKLAIEAYVPDNNRSQLHKTAHNTLILDAYNANPSSLLLAIDNLKSIDVPHKFFVIGEMREMGAYAASEHLAILNRVKTEGLKGIFVGAEFCRYKDQFDFNFFETAGEAKNYLARLELKGNTILIKGSRGIKLEEVVSVL